MKRIPLLAFQKAVYTLLSTYQDYPVYDDLPKDTTYPCIQIGAFTCKNNSVKNIDICDVSLQIEIFSEYQGKKEVNSVANNIISILSSVELDLSEDNFKIMSGEISMFESFSENNNDGYRGVITLDAKVQNLLN